jgi:large subunit ribosomal protein L33
MDDEPARREVHTVRATVMIDRSPCRKNKSVLQEVPTSMANDVRVRVTLVCSECKQRNYDTKKNKKNDPDRIELKKYCRFCRKHTVHKESK